METGFGSLLLVTARPRHWVKNVLVFVAPVFAHSLSNLQSVTRTTLAFGVFCALASASYLLNDAQDASGDRAHPFKRHRPIASGELPASVALIASVVLTLAGLALSMLLGRVFFWTALAFVLSHVAYSLFLQHIVILDVFALAANYVLRVVAGALAVNVPMSPWLLICTLLLSLFLGLSARVLDFKLMGEDAVLHRPSLVHYNPYLLDQMIAVITSAILVTYTLYAISPETAARFASPRLPLTIPFVMYGIFRYLYLIHQRTGHLTLEKALVADGPMRVNMALYAVCVFGIVYL